CSLTSFFTSPADPLHLHSFPTRRSSDLSRSLLRRIRRGTADPVATMRALIGRGPCSCLRRGPRSPRYRAGCVRSHAPRKTPWPRSEEHTSELQSRFDLVCRLLLEKKKKH